MDSVISMDKGPCTKPNNKILALTIFKSTVRRLMKNTKHADVYKEQINDTRKLSEKEMQDYSGPSYYITHHEY